MAEEKDTTPQDKPAEAPAALAQDTHHDVVEAAPAAMEDAKTGPYETIEVKDEQVIHETKAEEVVPKEATAPAPLAVPTPLSVIGKQYRGDMFPGMKTPEMVESERLEQAKYNHPDAVPIEVYFAVRGISDVGAQAARRRATTVQQATLEKWDEIFGASF